MASTSFTKPATSLITPGKYSDLTITAGDRTFKVHRVIVCTQSEFLAKACDGQFVEASDGIINLPDDDPDDIDRLISFLYNGDYQYEECQDTAQPRTPTVEATASDLDDDSVSSAGNGTVQEHGLVPSDVLEEMLTHIRMYALGDRLIIPELKNVAKDKFTSINDRDTFITGMPQLLRAAYTSTTSEDKGIRTRLVNAYVKYIIGSKAEDEHHRQVLLEIPEAHIAILQKWNNVTTEFFVEQNTALETEKRELQTENARLATEKRKAEEAAQEARQRADDATKMGKKKHNALVSKINRSQCSHCVVCPWVGMGNYERRMYLKYAENEYYSAQGPIVRCSGCDRTM